MEEFKVGDKVKTHNGEGEIIGIQRKGDKIYLVEHTNWIKGHNGHGYDLKEGTYPKINNSGWYYNDYELKLVKTKQTELINEFIIF